MPIQPIERQNISDIVFEQMKALIESGEWKPGDKIPSEPELTQKFGVSRVSVRAALQKLESLGVLQRYPGRGTIINEYASGQAMSQLMPQLIFNTPDLISLNDFREIVECGAVKLAAKNRTQDHLDQLELNFARMRQTIDHGEDSSALDVEFHYLIAKASGNPLLAQTYDILYQSFLKNMFKVKSIAKEDFCITYHRRLIDAVRAQDERLAETLMREHLKENTRIILDAEQAESR